MNHKARRSIGYEHSANNAKQNLKCVFCNEQGDTEGQLGTLITSRTSSLTAHEYCLTFSAGLFNQGEEETGMNGFLESGILEELKRAGRLFCKYCGKKGATLGCEDKKCKNAYHLPCAIRAECILQYFGAFHVFCQTHHIKQTISRKSVSIHKKGLRSLTSQEEHHITHSLHPIPLDLFKPQSTYLTLIPPPPPACLPAPAPESDGLACSCTLHRVKGPPLDLSPHSLLYYFSEPNPTHQSTISCGICLSDIDNKPSFHSLITPCCFNYFHRLCLQRMALSAGKHHFKCPMCGNVAEFQNEMQTFGINLPDRDALWEEGDAFHDLHSIFEECCAIQCICPNGRQFALDESMLGKEDPAWAILICTSCGQFGLHLECCRQEHPNLPCDLESDTWNCPTCLVVLDTIEGSNSYSSLKLKDFSIRLVKIK